MDKKCEFCGEMFEMRSARSRFCSPGCSNKNYYHANPEYRQAQKDNSRNRLATNPEARAVAYAAAKRWRENHRAEAIEATKRWEAANSDHVKKRKREWFDAHPEKRKEYHDKWKADHPERIRAFWKDNTNKRRAMKASADGSYSYPEFLSICDASGWLCVYCGCRLDVKTSTADHMIPLSRGGANDISNIALSCMSCNSKKHDKTVAEFMEYLCLVEAGGSE